MPVMAAVVVAKLLLSVVHVLKDRRDAVDVALAELVRKRVSLVAPEDEAETSSLALADDVPMATFPMELIMKDVADDEPTVKETRPAGALTPRTATFEVVATESEPEM